MFVFALYIEDEVKFELITVNMVLGNAQTLILNIEKYSPNSSAVAYRCHSVLGIPTSASEAKFILHLQEFLLFWQYKALRVDGAYHWNKCDLMPEQLVQRGM